MLNPHIKAEFDGLVAEIYVFTDIEISVRIVPNDEPRLRHLAKHIHLHKHGAHTDGIDLLKARLAEGVDPSISRGPVKGDSTDILLAPRRVVGGDDVLVMGQKSRQEIRREHHIAIKPQDRVCAFRQGVVRQGVARCLDQRSRSNPDIEAIAREMLPVPPLECADTDHEPRMEKISTRDADGNFHGASEVAGLDPKMTVVAVIQELGDLFHHLVVVDRFACGAVDQVPVDQAEIQAERDVAHVLHVAADMAVVVVVKALVALKQARDVLLSDDLDLISHRIISEEPLDALLFVLAERNEVHGMPQMRRGSRSRPSRCRYAVVRSAIMPCAASLWTFRPPS
ncbi:hypothetical protein CHELA1G11_12990 [Hyphomicrobiales bacterium]|nr:hypothetical protein CHELA1G2_11319 [Hyphomicrobiales bacterium]CAH1668536.1 hypothetical protein CHELA1G11_12990 [Hyphomicrobiales bacterium]